MNYVVWMTKDHETGLYEARVPCFTDMAEIKAESIEKCREKAEDLISAICDDMRTKGVELPDPEDTIDVMDIDTSDFISTVFVDEAD